MKEEWVSKNYTFILLWILFRYHTKHPPIWLSLLLWNRSLSELSAGSGYIRFCNKQGWYSRNHLGSRGELRQIWEQRIWFSWDLGDIFDIAFNKSFSLAKENLLSSKNFTSFSRSHKLLCNHFSAKIFQILKIAHPQK